MNKRFSDWRWSKSALLSGVILCAGLSALAEETANSVPAATNAAALEKVSAAETNATVATTNSNSTNAPEPKAEIAPLADGPTAPELGQLSTSGTLSKAETTNEVDRLKQFQMLLDLGREQRQEKSLSLASQTLVNILQTNAPVEFMRPALFELALVAQDEGKFARAQQIFGQYLHAYGNDPSAPEVLLRQGMVYRQMGVNTMAVSKFYAVMSTALKLKLDNMDYYKKLVLQAQIEIADTYYLEGKYADSADFFSRLLKKPAPELDKVQIEFKLIRSLSFLSNNDETVARAQMFLEMNTNSMDVPEVRFLLASTLKRLGRNHESMKQVLLLLQSQQENVRKNPETYIYWQQRAGNEIANQLYKEGDYVNALQIYLSLADLDKSPAWQLPVWYQTGLVYEQLQQWQKATETYSNIMDRKKELTEVVSTPSLQSLVDMAKWRKEYLDWFQKAKQTNLAFKSTFSDKTNNLTSLNTP